MSLAKMLSGANAFEISHIQEDEADAALTWRSGCDNVAWVEDGWMEFSGSTTSQFGLLSFPWRTDNFGGGRAFQYIVAPAFNHLVG